MAARSRLRWIFVGERGIRPGWRFALFLAMVQACGPVFDYLLPKIHFPDRALNWSAVVLNDALDFAFIAALTAIMCRIERRRFSSYGLRMASGWKRLFGQGVVWGAAPSFLILIPIWLARGCSFHGLALAPGALLRSALLWAVAFLILGVAEEFTFRGYALQVLTQGIGFWPAALVMSGIFGFLHFLKPNDGYIDPITVALYGLFCCFTWWRTGTLWFAIGFHAASDYVDMVLFAEPNTGNGGQAVPGHLLNVVFHGPDWLTGGPRGTEASLLVFAVLAGLFFLFDKAYPKKRAGAQAELPARSWPALARRR